MKHVFSKLSVLLALIMTLFFLIGGTASAHSATSNHQTFTATQAQAASPLCGYTQASNWIWNPGYGNVNIIKWVDTCDGGYHCEAIDKSYYGAIYHVGIWLELDTNQGAYSYAYKYPFQENQIINTPTLHSGYTGYTCNPSVYIP